MTKALELRRAEIAELADGDDMTQKPPKPATVSMQRSLQDRSQRLSFYDVVQLARQQELVEKTRKSNKDFKSSGDLDPSKDTKTIDDIERLDDVELIEDFKPLDILNPDGDSELGDGLVDLKPSEDLKVLDSSSRIGESKSSEDRISNDDTVLGTDLIDFSDVPLPVRDSKPSKSVEGVYSLLDSSIPLAPDQTDSSLLLLKEAEALNPSQEFVLYSTQAANSAIDAISPGQSCVSDMSDTVENPISHADTRPKKDTHGSLPSPLTSRKSYPPPHQPTTDGHLEPPLQDVSITPKEAVCSGSTCVRCPSLHEDDELPVVRTPMNPQTSFVHDISGETISERSLSTEALASVSPLSTAAPSLFSNDSSSTTKTGFLLGITEEDVLARNSSSSTGCKSSPIMPKLSPSLLKRRTSDSLSPSLSRNTPPSKEAERFGSASTDTPVTVNVDLDSQSGPLQSEAENSMCEVLELQTNLNEPDERGFPWIVQAARDGNEQVVQKLLISGADIKASHATSRRSALHEASIQNHQKIVNLLIEEKCPLGSIDIEGYTALHLACQKGHLTVAKTLLNAGAFVDARGPRRQTALHLAMRVPYQNVVMLLIQHKASVNVRDDSSQTPLHICAMQGNVAMCNYLLNEGAQLDSREVQSKTPLQIACEAGHYDLTQMMLNQSNLKPTTLTFLNAFFAAVESGHVRVAESFFVRGLKLPELKRDSYKPAVLAVKSGCLAMLELILSENCDINATDEDGWNALHFASYYGHYQIVERLTANKFSIETTTSKRDTPLLLAVKAGHFAVAERLLGNIEPSNILDVEGEYGQRPVHYTARTGFVELSNLLLSYGAKINVANSFGWQPLHIATAYGNLALVQRLIQQGANIEGRLSSPSIKKDRTHKYIEDGYWAEARWPYEGSRPMHLACEFKHYHIAQYLISKGTKLETTCNEGWQPLHHATFVGSSALVEMLLAYNVYPHAATNEGRTAETMGFCTSGVPIPEDEKETIRQMLREAMSRVKKQKQNFKAALKRGSTVDEKNSAIRAVTFSMEPVSRPQLHRAAITMQTSDVALSQTISSHARPQIPHMPRTSPLPQVQTPSESVLHAPPTQQLCDPQVGQRSTTPRITSDLMMQETQTIQSKAGRVENATDQFPISINIDTLIPIPTPTMEKQLSSIEPTPKIKRKSTLALGKMKPGVGMGLGISNIGRQTFEIGKQGIELGKQGIVLGKQGVEFGKQGIESGKQGLEIGRKGYKKATRFARKGERMLIEDIIPTVQEMNRDSLLDNRVECASGIVGSVDKSIVNAVNESHGAFDIGSEMVADTMHRAVNDISNDANGRINEAVDGSTDSDVRGIDRIVDTNGIDGANDNRLESVSNTCNSMTETNQGLHMVGKGFSIRQMNFTKGKKFAAKGEQREVQRIGLGRRTKSNNEHGRQVAGDISVERPTYNRAIKSADEEGLGPVLETAEEIGGDAVQGLDLAKGLDNLGKIGYKKAMKFAKLPKGGKLAAVGKIGARTIRREKRLNDGDGTGAGNEIDAAVNMGVDNVADSMTGGGDDDDRNEDDEDDGSILDDAGSVFSLGEFGDLGSDDF